MIANEQHDVMTGVQGPVTRLTNQFSPKTTTLVFGIDNDRAKEQGRGLTNPNWPKPYGPNHPLTVSGTQTQIGNVLISFAKALRSLG